MSRLTRKLKAKRASIARSEQRGFVTLKYWAQWHTKGFWDATRRRGGTLIIGPKMWSSGKVSGRGHRWKAGWPYTLLTPSKRRRVIQSLVAALSAAERSRPDDQQGARLVAVLEMPEPRWSNVLAFAGDDDLIEFCSRSAWTSIDLRTSVLAENSLPPAGFKRELGFAVREEWTEVDGPKSKEYELWMIGDVEELVKWLYPGDADQGTALPEPSP